MWKDIEGTDGYIQVNELGEVRSLLTGKEKILKQQVDNKGYTRVTVTYKRKKIRIKPHRAVAKLFVENPDNYPQVNHKDGNKLNNRADNLEWCTNQQNCIHAVKMGLWDTVIEGSIRENMARRKPVVAYKDGEIKHFDSVVEAQKYFGSRHISDVLKGKRSHVKGWKFKYAKEVMTNEHKHTNAF